MFAKYGKGFTKSNLYSFYAFYKAYPNIFQTLSGKSTRLLSWSHYAILLQVNDRKVRDWYEKEAHSQTWSVRTLQRNISSQYYYRMLQTQKPEIVEAEMKELTIDYQNDKLEFIKNPVITEFLGLSSDTDFTEKQDYYIDLVFYNYILKCFVLIDLKTQKITHQDVGQMDMYIRMYDELKRSEGDNPTIGIVLCSDTDEDIARYSVMHCNEQLFVSKYKLYLPTEEELRAEIEAQKTMFYLQQQEKRGIKYMMWEEKILYERRDALDEERIRVIKRKLKKNKSVEQIADELEITVEEAEKYLELIREQE